MAVKKKRLQILDKPTTLKTTEEIDEFIRKVLISTDGWFDPESLWEIENPYFVFRRLDELDLRVYTYKKRNTFKSLSSINELVDKINEDYIAVCQYNKHNKDDNFLQDLYLTHWLDRQCYFSKVGQHNVCFIYTKERTLKVFPGQFIIKHGIGEYTISSINKEDLESNYIKIH